MHQSAATETEYTGGKSSASRYQESPSSREAKIFPVFAYGVAAYELLTGRKPFAGETPDEILRKQLNRSPDFLPPRELNAEIPASLEKAILKCLEREPDKRYPIMNVLVLDLQTALYV